MSFLITPTTITDTRLGGFYSDGKYLLTIGENESDGTFLGAFYKGTSQSDDYIGIVGKFWFEETMTRVSFRLLGATVNLNTIGKRNFKTLYLGAGVISAGIGNFQKVSASGHVAFSRGSPFDMCAVYRTDCLKFLEIVKCNDADGTFQGTFVDYKNGVALENVAGIYTFDRREELTRLTFKTSKSTWSLQAVFNGSRPCFTDWESVSDAGEQVTFYKDYIPHLKDPYTGEIQYYDGRL